MIPFRHCLVILALLPPALLPAEVTVPAIFSNHAVLQKSDKVPIWGKGESGEEVRVTLDRATATTKTGPDGKWKAALDLHEEDPGPYNLVIQGKNQLSFSDVLVGEVWLCGGQSNMDFPLAAFPIGKEEIPLSANPLLRQFKVKFNASPVPVDDVQGQWVLADPKTSGQFSATGYFFGKEIQKETGQPVGLLNNCVGGTVIETWMSADALASDPDLKSGAEKAQQNRLAFDDYIKKYNDWMKQNSREDHAPADPLTFAAPGLDPADWKPVTLPDLFAAAGLPDSGAIWVRKTITVPAAPDIGVGKGIDLFLADIRDADQVYWNGTRVGSSDITATIHRYGIRPALVKAGDNVLALRIFNPAGGAGILKNGRFQGNHFMLEGEWLGKPEFELPPLDTAAKASFPERPVTPMDPQNVAGYLYNGMINPVVSYALRGIIWYQGEGNWARGYQYRSEFKTLITDWRAKWEQGDMPFYYCQVANFQQRSTKPGNDMQSELREAQSMALSLPNTGQAILIDIGEEFNIHPANKKETGGRLARLALARTYGKNVVASGPVYESMQVKEGKVWVKFGSTDGGLIAKPLVASNPPVPGEVPIVRNSPDGDLEGFALCGEDHKWVWANAKIDGDSVIVWSDKIPQPVALRYAWGTNPLCNLYNGGGLPAGPFRTDDFPPVSLKARY